MVSRLRLRATSCRLEITLQERLQEVNGCNRSSGEVISHATIAKEMVKIRRLTGIEGLVVHHLRHLCATVMMLNDVPPRIAQGVLGHATSATTMRIY